MKTILLPTDFSDNAWNAIFTAVKLYTKMECRFILLHAYEPKALNLLGRKGQQRVGIIYDSLAEHSKQELTKVLEYLQKDHDNPKHHFEILSKSDTLAEAVKNILLERDIDLIAMGTQGATGAKQIFMGSNTVKVLKQIESCPILIVPAEHDFKSLKVLAFPTDFSKKYKKQQLAPITELASIWTPEIQVLHVALEFTLNDRQEVHQKQLMKVLEDFDTIIHNLDYEADVAHTLSKFITDSKVDLMAVIRYHHTFWEKLIGEPVVKKLGFHSKVPLMVLPE